MSSGLPGQAISLPMSLVRRGSIVWGKVPEPNGKKIRRPHPVVVIDSIIGGRAAVVVISSKTIGDSQWHQMISNGKAGCSTRLILPSYAKAYWAFDVELAEFNYYGGFVGTNDLGLIKAKREQYEYHALTSGYPRASGGAIVSS